MSKITDRLVPAISDSMADIKRLLIQELSQEGHRLTGSLESSISFEVKADAVGVTAILTAFDYALVLEFGVPASRIPYGGRTGRGGQSKYIQGLYRFFTLRGLGTREALGAAFATANVHRREGMPSRGSYAFSSNGRRTGFTRSVFESYLPTLRDKITEKSGLIVELAIADKIRLEPYSIAV